MARRWAPDKIAVMDSLADEILANYRFGRTLVAVDGIDGAGQEAFADDLAVSIGRTGHAVFRASVDRFLRPRAERFAKGEHSAEAYYRDSFDYDTLRRVLIDPFRSGGSTGWVTDYFDAARDMLVVDPTWITGPADAVLVVDGTFLNRPELRGLWHWSAWLDADPQAAAQRLLTVDGPSALSERYRGAQALYEADANPRAKATAIVDNTDPAVPRRVFADAC
jgi:uridine kinase